MCTPTFKSRAGHLELSSDQLGYCIQGLEDNFDEQARLFLATETVVSQENDELKRALKLLYKQVHEFIAAGDHALAKNTSTTFHPATHPGARQFVANWVARMVEFAAGANLSCLCEQ